MFHYAIDSLHSWSVGCLFSSVLKVFDNFLHVCTLQGHDTVSSALGFCTHLLGVHTDVQKKCQQELDQIMGMCAVRCDQVYSLSDVMSPVIRKTNAKRDKYIHIHNFSFSLEKVVR